MLDRAILRFLLSIHHQSREGTEDCLASLSGAVNNNNNKHYNNNIIDNDDEDLYIEVISNLAFDSTLHSLSCFSKKFS